MPMNVHSYACHNQRSVMKSLFIRGGLCRTRVTLVPCAPRRKPVSRRIHSQISGRTTVTGSPGRPKWHRRQTKRHSWTFSPNEAKRAQSCPCQAYPWEASSTRQTYFSKKFPTSRQLVVILCLFVHEALSSPFDARAHVPERLEPASASHIAALISSA